MNNNIYFELGKTYRYTYPGGSYVILKCVQSEVPNWFELTSINSDEHTGFKWIKTEPIPTEQWKLIPEFELQSAEFGLL